MWPFVSRLAHRLLLPPLVVGSGRPGDASPGGGGSAPGSDAALAAFLEATADPMLLFGPDFVVTAANEAAGRLLREPPARLIGRSVLESAPLSRLLSAAQVPQRLQGGTRLVRDEVTMADPEGQPVECRLEAVRLPGGTSEIKKAASWMKEEATFIRKRLFVKPLIYSDTLQ